MQRENQKFGGLFGNNIIDEWDPFMCGTVYSILVYKEYLRENELFHRCCSFTYDGLSEVIKDAMNDLDAVLPKVGDGKFQLRIARVHGIEN